MTAIIVMFDAKKEARDFEMEKINLFLKFGPLSSSKHLHLGRLSATRVEEKLCVTDGRARTYLVVFKERRKQRP